MLDRWFDALYAEVFTAAETVFVRMLLKGVIDQGVEGVAFWFYTRGGEEFVFELSTDTMGWVVIYGHGADWFAFEQIEEGLDPSKGDDCDRQIQSNEQDF
jgi:hypothetical protein